MNSKDKKSLSNRAKRKYLNTPVLSHLMDLNSPYKYKYLGTTQCSSRIEQKDGKLSSRYCKRMWCTICAPIRTAVRLNNYSKSLLLLNDIYLTTLTIPNVPADKLTATISNFRKTFKQYRDTYKKRTGTDLKGVYNFEVTINIKSGLYHPHIHVIHEYLETQQITYLHKKTTHNKLTNTLIDYWLKKEKTASILAQDTRPCTDLIEGFKYQSKSVFFLKVNGKKEYYLPAQLLDSMYQALKGVRCFQAFGIKIISEELIEKQMNELEAYQTDKPQGSYIWDKEKTDWILVQTIDQETGEILTHETDSTIKVHTELTGYKPTTKTKAIYEKLQSGVRTVKPQFYRSETN